MRICFIALGNFMHVMAYLEYFKNADHDVHFISLSPGPDYGVKTYNVGFRTGYSAQSGKLKYPLSILYTARTVARAENQAGRCS